MKQQPHTITLEGLNGSFDTLLASSNGKRMFCRMTIKDDAVSYMWHVRYGNSEVIVSSIGAAIRSYNKIDETRDA